VETRGQQEVAGEKSARLPVEIQNFV
jgi:hypothetical protein